MKHGWLILDKPEGITSAHAVGKVKRLTGCKKIGHAGTLDPLATGVLPLALGEATKTIPYVTDADKDYVFTVAWGEERSTGDREGEVTVTSPVRPSREAILRAIPAFTGAIQQVPPVYSAIKVNGERAYDLARQGQAVELKPRPVQVYSYELIDLSENRASFSVRCGKGTYIRSLAVDLARALGTVGYVAALRRTRVGRFTENRTISLEKLEELVHKEPPEKWLGSVESALDDIPALEVDSNHAARLKAGQAVPRRPGGATEGRVLMMHAGRPVAICEVQAGNLQPIRVFNS